MVGTLSPPDPSLSFWAYKGCGPSSTDHPEGMSTEMIGTLLSWINLRILSNGFRTGGWNEKPYRGQLRPPSPRRGSSSSDVPKIASMITSHDLSLCSNAFSSLITSMPRFSHCRSRRW